MVSRLELRRIFRSPVVMVVVALAIRLMVMGLMYGEKKPITRALFTLPSEMARVASSIASGEGFASPLPDPTGPTAWVVPVYAYLLAGVFRVFGVYTAASAVAILTINSLFSALTCLPIHALARKSFGPTVATAAGWTWVVFPYAVYTPVHWIWEACLATLLLTLLVLLAVRLDEAPNLWAWVGFGALWGVAALTNTGGSRATITFTGTGITWIGVSDGWSGLATVYLDGNMKIVDTYGNPTRYQQPLYTARGLSSGTHTLSIEITHERDGNTQGSWVWIDAFDIENGSAVPGGVTATTGRIEENNPALSFVGRWYSNGSAAHSGGNCAQHRTSAAIPARVDHLRRREA